MAISSNDAFGAGGGARRRRRSARGRRGTLSEINVTPLVDVMLVLLIVFMISAPLLTVGVPVDLPKTEAGDRPRHALPRMLQGALREWRDARTRGLATDGQAAFLIQRIDRVLDAAIARESARVEEGLGSLAIVATASPFVGLFGTVWGIMHAFQSIAIQKNTSLAVVAPSIAEALFATAIGLIAAIPAYIAFNKFSTDAGKFAARLEGFADDLSTAIQRRLADRG